jgi:small-conductance mechanosensitive channel
VELFGIKLIGATQQTAHKLLLTLAAIVVLLTARVLIVAIVGFIRGHRNDRIAFWTKQGTNLPGLVIVVTVLLSIWFDDTRSLASAMGFAAAGFAIAAQRAVTAFAGYLIIMRGHTFTVGDRIKMGGVQGDVIALGFLQTRILEMGQPEAVNEQEPPGMWVRARQYTGRVVTVTNDKVFDEAIYNFTREFPFIWEEITVPVPYRADRARAERILLEAARAVTEGFVASSQDGRAAFEARYNVRLDAEEPRVYWRMTDNWVELTVRFLVPEHGIREMKDRMTRRILGELDAAKIEVASATFEVVGVPPLRIERRPTTPRPAEAGHDDTRRTSAR